MNEEDNEYELEKIDFLNCGSKKKQIGIKRKGNLDKILKETLQLILYGTPNKSKTGIIYRDKFKQIIARDFVKNTCEKEFKKIYLVSSNRTCNNLYQHCKKERFNEHIKKLYYIELSNRYSFFKYNDRGEYKF